MENVPSTVDFPGIRTSIHRGFPTGITGFIASWWGNRWEPNSGPRTVRSIQSIQSEMQDLQQQCPHLATMCQCPKWSDWSSLLWLPDGQLGVPGLVATFTVCELENHHVLLVNQLFLWPFWTAMLVYQRVYPIRRRILKIRGRLNPCCGAKRQSAEKALTQSSHGRVWWSHSSSEKSAHWKSQKSHWAGVQTLVLRQNQGTWECISHEKFLQTGFLSWMSCHRQKQLLPKWSQFMNRSHTIPWFQSWSIWNGLSWFINVYHIPRISSWYSHCTGR